MTSDDVRIVPVGGRRVSLTVTSCAFGRCVGIIERADWSCGLWMRAVRGEKGRCVMAIIRNDNRRGANRRDERAAQAAKHIAEVDATLGKEVARSLSELRVYDAMPKVEAERRVPSVRVVDQDSVSAIMELGRGLASACDMAVLNFASFTNPGGGYDRGAWAQEEALCAESTLFNVLRDQHNWYGMNRRRNINCELYRNRGLVVPKVRFDRGKFHKYADVIVVAAPNARRARADYHVAEDTLLTAMRNRIRFVLAIADDLGHDKLVLGAYGCGAFGWDAEVVAKLFLEELASGKHVASRVTFAIPKANFDENLPRFEHVFANFPEANDQPYVPLAERPKPVVEQTDDEDDDDDWRQYL